MANTVSYNMGQIRYNTGGDYITDLEFSDHVIVTPSLSNSVSYRDIILYSKDDSFIFSQNESYYLRLHIPRNLSYNMTFDLKLLDRAGSRNQYQEIKRFVVPRDSSNQLTYSRIILYPHDGVTENAEPAVNIVKAEKDAAIGDVYLIIKEDEKTKKTIEEKFYIKKADGESDVEIKLKNDVLLNHTWKEDVSSFSYPIDFVFSNKVDNVSFNAILLELNRNSYDDDISYEVDGVVYKGLFVGDTNAEKQKETGNIGVECYRINNLIPSAGVSSFDSIGVWSHPDAIMSINGEEIRIGQSGYYELNDFNITNFGIVAKDANDRFSLDYQYKVT